MAASNRASQFTRIHKILKKHYEAVAPRPDRPILENLLFACCLEDAHCDIAEESFAALEQTFFDWNEIRVSSVVELVEVMPKLPEPPVAANRIKKILQDVFETHYSYDLEAIRKKNLGPAAEQLRKIDGATLFVASYVIQVSLGGHAIPIDTGAARLLGILALASEKEVDTKVISGLERAIAKNKGVEFGSLLHQLSADFISNPFSAEVRQILLEIDPDAKSRWPKRQVRKRVVKVEEGKAKKAVKKSSKQPIKATKKSTKKKEVVKRATKKTKTAKKKTTAERKRTSTRTTSQARKKTPVKKKKKAVVKKQTPVKKAKRQSVIATRKSASARLSKRKPR